VELWGPGEQRLDQLQAAIDEVKTTKGEGLLDA
jgi:hypothetical protein